MFSQRTDNSIYKAVARMLADAARPLFVLVLLSAVTIATTGCNLFDDDESYSGYTPPEGDDYEPPDQNDLDYDNVPLDTDNCGDRYNPEQTDSDGDGLGDACDNCPMVENGNQQDSDGDSYGDVCEECPDDPTKIAEGTCGCGTPDLDLNGDGEFDCEGVPTFIEMVVDSAQLSQIEDLELVDLDGNGELDIVVALANTDAVYGYLNQGGGASWFKITIAEALTVLAMDLAIADIDGDGDLDVAVAELYDRFVGPESPGQIVWYRQPADTVGAWQRHDVTDQTVWGARSIAAADLSDDGQIDLVVSRRTVMDADGIEQGDGVVVFENFANGDSWSAPQEIDSALEDAVTVITHDIDGDGLQDVLAAGFEDNDIFWYRNDTSNGPMTFSGFSTGLTPAPFDIAVVEGGFGYTSGTAIITVAGDFSNGLELNYQAPLGDRTDSWISWRIADDFPGGTEARVAPVDFNGDGVMDVAVASEANAAIRVYLGNAEGAWAPLEIANGVTGLSDIATGDINGDGTPDVVAVTSGRSGGDRILWWPNQ